MYLSVFLSVSPGSQTPKWEDVSSSRGDADKEMAVVAFHCFACFAVIVRFSVIVRLFACLLLYIVSDN